MYHVISRGDLREDVCAGGRLELTVQCEVH